jgi:sterol desaturase/sphingolipid hydroxylase (fatty acid hydroxylase superfamily)
MKKNVEEYIAFKNGEIRIPSHLKVKKEEKTTLYKNKIIEFLSRSPFGVPHTMWIIIAIFLFWYAIATIGLPVPSVIMTGLLGVLSWTLVEYLIHRFVYHTETNSEEVINLQANLHGVHHHYPKDPERLAMPPVPGLIIGGVFFGLSYLIMSNYAFAYFPGFILGYDLYITLHYFQHRIKSPDYKPWRKLWQHHKAHHYSNPYSAFGVSTRLWDVVFGTMPKSSNKKRQIEVNV